jgi:ribose 5-phosphate isomerase B
MYLASDHGGYALKEKVKEYLSEQDISFKDLGPKQLEPDDDYPDYIMPLAEKVAQEDSRGIISCRNGQGAAIAANKVPGIRAVVCWNTESVQSARNDDNANILSLPADYLDDRALKSMLDAWLATPFSHDARHLRRINKITDYEQEGR